MQEILSELIQPAIIGIFGFIAWFMKGLAASVRELNERMAVYIERVTMIVEHLEDHEGRLRRLENGDNQPWN